MNMHFCYLETGIVIDDTDYDRELDENEVREEAIIKFKELLDRAIHGKEDTEVDILIETEEGNTPESEENA